MAILATLIARQQPTGPPPGVKGGGAASGAGGPGMGAGGGARGPPLGLMPPPPGVVPNFDNPETLFPRVVTTHLVTVCLAFAFILIRLWTRYFVSRSMWWDDYLAVFALIVSIGYVICSIHAFHVWDIRRSTWNWTYNHRWTVSGYALYMFGMGTVKVSILLLYLRIFSAGNKLKIVSYVLIAYVAGYVIAGELSLVFGCRPLRKLFQPLIKGKCRKIQIHVLTQAAFNFVADVLIVLAPIPVVWRLNFPLRYKLAVIGVFTTGFFVCVISGIRFSIAVNFTHPDFTWKKALADMWSAIELNLAIICSCMPALKPFIAFLIPHIRRLTSRGSSSAGSSAPGAHKKLGKAGSGANARGVSPRTSHMLHPSLGHDADYLELGKGWKNEVSVTTAPSSTDDNDDDDSSEARRAYGGNGGSGGSTSGGGGGGGAGGGGINGHYHHYRHISGATSGGRSERDSAAAGARISESEGIMKTVGVKVAAS